MSGLNQKKLWLISGYALLCVVILFVIEQVLMLPFAIKTMVKVPMFTLLPYTINHYILKTKMAFKIEKEEIKPMVIWSILVIGSIVIGYFIVESFLNADAIRSDIDKRMQLSGIQLLIAAFYTTFVNSFIEEYFFRGFVFLGIDKISYKKSAYFISASLFAVYHVTIFVGWFSWPMMLLMLLGLLVGGFIFAYFAHKTKSLLGSWLIHVSADLAIIIIGIFVLDLDIFGHFI